MIFDTHAHYDDEDFDLDRDELLLGMKAAGVSHIVNIGASLESTKRSLELAKKYDFIYAAVGVHPSDTTELNEETFSWLKQQCKEEKVVAVGEIGLDYYWDEPDRAIQKEWFARQIALGREEKLPLVIHSRDAAADTIDIMKSEKAEEAGGILHCFSYTKETAKIFLDMDFSFGIGGVITFKNAKASECIMLVPNDRILIETDSPYLSPEPYRGTRNTSTNVIEVAKKISEVKECSLEEIAKITYDNAKKIYKI